MKSIPPPVCGGQSSLAHRYDVRLDEVTVYNGFVAPGYEPYLQLDHFTVCR